MKILLRPMIALLPVALFATAVVAQPAPGTNPPPGGPGAGGPGMGGPGMGGPGMGGQGMGPGMGPGMGGPGGGSQLMTPEERTAHMNKMRGMKTYGECMAYEQEHRKLMEQRAKEKGVTLPTPRVNPCDRMKARGQIN